MKISVLCASRNNKEDLRTIIGALHMLESGNNEIEYKISAEIKPALGAVWNNIVKIASANVHVFVTDRALCITPHWDTYIADAIAQNDTRVLWWNTNAGQVIPIIPHKWLEAAGQIYSDYFPFWFDDTWLKELSALVHGLPIPVIRASCFIAKKNPMTKRMRDLRFWMDFFIAKRPERIEHAKKIREKLGLPEPDMIPIAKWFRQEAILWDTEWRNWESLAGDKSDPDESYLIAKRNAEDFINGKSA